MLKNLTPFIALLIVAVSTPAFADYLPEEADAESTIPTRERVEAFLESERYVLSRLELRQLADFVVADLAEIATDRDVRKRTRARAVQCLGLYPNDSVAQETVSELFTKTRPGDRLFEVLLVTHVQVGGSSATESVIHYLDHDDVSVRRSVIVALGRFGGQLEFELLKARKTTEKSPELKALIAKYVD